MFDLYHNGNIIGFTVNGTTGTIIIFYLLFELGFFLIGRTLIIHKIFLGLRVRYQVKKMIPKWWYIKKISYLTINSNHDDYVRYEVFIKVMSKVEGNTNDWRTVFALLKVDWLGKIKEEDLLSNIEFEDVKYQKEIKQWHRDKLLKDIGI